MCILQFNCVMIHNNLALQYLSPTQHYNLHNVAKYPNSCGMTRFSGIYRTIQQNYCVECQKSQFFIMLKFFYIFMCIMVFLSFLLCVKFLKNQKSCKDVCKNDQTAEKFKWVVQTKHNILSIYVIVWIFQTVVSLALGM